MLADAGEADLSVRDEDWPASDRSRTVAAWLWVVYFAAQVALGVWLLA